MISGKIGEAKYGGNPPFFTQNFFFHRDLEWLEMYFKHNFIKCNILTCETPPPQCNISYLSFFLKASLREGFQKKVGDFPLGKGGLKISKNFPTFLKFIFKHGLNHPEIPLPVGNFPTCF